ncbi:MAG: methyltransferase domain-containing protein [Candidatus Heimdallarchaeota archaeon]|nr:methyltransferase domain-containing protein [Candidatus Heimdallarchaeota archaeon]
MDLFSKIAGSYDKIIRGFALDTIREFIKLVPDKLLLDLGGGTGRVSTELDDHVNGCILLDRSFEMLQQASKKSRNLLIVQGVGENLPFKENSIPQIFANDTLHHVQFQNETLENCHCVMTPNGKMIIREYDPEYWKTKFLIFFEWVLLFRSTFLSPRRLEEMCQKIGFSVDWQRLSKSTYLLNANKPN